VADVEEDFGDGLGLEDLLEGCGVVRVRGRERFCAKGMDVDEVDFVAGLDEDGDQGEGAVSGEVVAFEIDEEVWLGAGLWQVVEERRECVRGVDHFDLHLCVL